MPGLFNLPGPGPLLAHVLEPYDAPSVPYTDSATVYLSIQIAGPDGAADNFNRSDSADLGTNWTPIFGEAPYTIASGLARPSNYSNFNNAEVYTGMSWSADQYSESIIINPHSGAGSGAGIGVVVRGSTSERTYYGFVCNANAGFGWQLFKWVNGTGSTIASGGTAFVHADVVRLEVIGTTLNVYRNGALFTTATDSSIVDGSPGIVLAPFSFDSMNENWSGGSIAVDTLQAVDSATVYLDLQVGTATASAITVDQANIGELIQNAAVATTSVLTTTQTVAPNALIVLTVNWFTAGSTVLQGVSGGGLTWTIDKHIESVGGECAAIVSAPAPAGLASGTAITVDFGDTSSAARLIAGSSFLGLNLTATKVHASNAFIPNYTTNWAGSGFNTTTPTLLIGMTTSAGHGNPTSTPNGGEVEAHDFHDSAGQHVQIVNYEISTTPGFHQLGGAWSSDQTGTGDRKCVDIAYNAAEYHTETFTIITANDDGSGYWKDTVPYTWPPAESWVDETSNNIYVAKGEAVYYYANNGFWRWDTSGLPDAASIVSGTFAPCLISGDPNMGGSFIGDYYDFGGEPTVSADGIITVASPIWTPVTVSSVNSSGAGYQSFALTDLSGINKSGYTGIRASLDASGTTPPTGGFQSSLVWSSYELGNPASLVVSYYVPVGGPVDIFLPVDSATVLVDLQSSGSEIYTPAAGGTAYTESATILVDLQSSGTETADLLDTAACALLLTVTSVELHEIPDSASVLIDLQSSGTETAQFVDAATVPMDLDTSATEVHEIPDSASVYLDIQTSDTQLFAGVDAATGNVILTVTSAELHEIPDAASVYLDIQTSSTETVDFADVISVYLDLQPSGVDTQSGTTLDADTVLVDLQSSGSELQEASDSNTAYFDLSVTATEEHTTYEVVEVYFDLQISDTQTFAGLDAATAALLMSITSTEEHATYDAGTVLIDLQNSGTETSQFVDSNTVYLDIDTSATEVHEIPDAASVYLDIQTSSIETADLVDSASVYFDLQSSGTEFQSGQTTDAATASVLLTPSAVEIVQYVDQNSVYFDIDCSGTEFISGAQTDADTVLVDLQTSATELTEFADSATAYVDLQPSSTDIYGRTTTDADSIYFDLQPTTADVSALVDATTVSFDLDVLSTELAQFVDATSVYFDLQWSATGGVTHDDLATVRITLGVITVELFVPVDAQLVQLLLQPSTFEAFGFEDAAQVYLDIQPGAIFLEVSFLLEIVGYTTRWSIGVPLGRWNTELPLARHTVVAPKIRWDLSELITRWSLMRNRRFSWRA